MKKKNALKKTKIHLMRVNIDKEKLLSKGSKSAKEKQAVNHFLKTL